MDGALSWIMVSNDPGMRIMLDLFMLIQKYTLSFGGMHAAYACVPRKAHDFTSCMDGALSWIMVSNDPGMRALLDLFVLIQKYTLSSGGICMPHTHAYLK